MTLKRIFLAAHHRHDMLPRAAHQALDALPEGFRLTHAFIIDATFLVVQLRRRRPATELIAKKDVSDAGPAQNLGELWPVGVGLYRLNGLERTSARAVTLA